jgi:hypothetical protein
MSGIFKEKEIINKWIYKLKFTYVNLSVIIYAHI